MQRSFYDTLKCSLRRYRRNYYTRKQLMKLDAAALKDIGISRAEALEEARKPFWKEGTESKEHNSEAVQQGASLVALCGCMVIVMVWFF